LSKGSNGGAIFGHGSVSPVQVANGGHCRRLALVAGPEALTRTMMLPGLAGWASSEGLARDRFVIYLTN
jgi:hypothetical protein